MRMTSIAIVLSIIAGTAMVVSPAVSAHPCETVKQKKDAAGCDAHDCTGTEMHEHVHDTGFWDWSQTDHACVANKNVDSMDVSFFCANGARTESSGSALYIICNGP